MELTLGQRYIDGPMGADAVGMQFEGERSGSLVFTFSLSNVTGGGSEYLYKLN